MSAITIYQPFTYLIGWSHLNKFYYGVKYAKGCHPKQLLTEYFTSSKLVHQYIDDYGLPDVVQIRKTFTSAQEARKWEHKVLRRIGAVKNLSLLNKSDSISIPIMCGADNPMFGKSRPDTSKLMRENNPMRNPHTAKKVSTSKKGKPSWNKGIENPIQSKKMRENNPMSNQQSLIKMLETQRAIYGGSPVKGSKWFANIHTKKRKRVKPDQLDKFKKCEGWIPLSCKEPIPDII